MTPEEKTKMQQELQALVDLVATAGWDVLKAKMVQEHGAAKAKMLTASISDIAKHVGAFATIETLMNWPENRIDAIRRILSQSEDLTGGEQDG